MTGSPRWAWAYLCRAAPAGDVELWAVAVTQGALAAVEYIRTDPQRRTPLPGGGREDPRSVAEADMAAVHDAGGRFLAPGDEQWPVEAFRGLESVSAQTAGVLAQRRGARGRGRSAADVGRPGPTRLAPPFGLYVLGPANLAVEYARSVAVVGSRAATAYGDHVAREFGFGLGERSMTVVSGGAYGIDAAAHRGVVASRGTTIAVLAGGVDVPYPKGNARLLAAVGDCGALVSERPPGSTVGREHFLVRNRLIAALTGGVVVVEAPARSGALATARRAALMARPVMAVPGPVTSALSVGCHLLLREYAAVAVTCVDHVMEVLCPVGEQLAAWPQGPQSARDGLSDEQRLVLDALSVDVPRSVADLARGSGVPVPDVRQSLGPLLSRGLVEELPAGGENEIVSFVMTSAGRDDGLNRIGV